MYFKRTLLKGGGGRGGGGGPNEGYSRKLPTICDIFLCLVSITYDLVWFGLVWFGLVWLGLSFPKPQPVALGQIDHPEATVWGLGIKIFT